MGYRYIGLYSIYILQLDGGGIFLRVLVINITGTVGGQVGTSVLVIWEFILAIPEL